MATYNGSQFLEAQLSSILKQTRLPNEVVISDDESTDTTKIILNNFSDEAPFDVIILNNKTRLGYTANFNKALEATSGDLVFLCDQDDVWFPNKLEQMCMFMNENPNIMLALCDAELTDANLERAGVTKLGQIRSSGLPNSTFVMGCCSVVRRQLLNISLPIPSEFKGHDTWLSRIADGLNSKAIIDKPLQLYRRHGNNESTFIANKLKKVTWKDVLWLNFRGSIKKRGQKGLEFAAQVANEKLFLNGIKSAALKCENDYANSLMALQSEITNKIKIIEERGKVRNLSAFPRLIHALIIWKRGDYGLFSGYKSLLRDVFLP